MRTSLQQEGLNRDAPRWHRNMLHQFRNPHNHVGDALFQQAAFPDVVSTTIVESPLRSDELQATVSAALANLCAWVHYGEDIKTKSGHYQNKVAAIGAWS